MGSARTFVVLFVQEGKALWDTKKKNTEQNKVLLSFFFARLYKSTLYTVCVCVQFSFYTYTKE